MQNGCGCYDPGKAAEIFQDHSIELGMMDARESDHRNYITSIHPPVLRNAVGGPAEGPTPPGGVNDSIMCIIEARSFDLQPFYLRSPSEIAAQSVFVDESALYLDEGYIDGSDGQWA